MATYGTLELCPRTGTSQLSLGNRRISRLEALEFAFESKEGTQHRAVVQLEKGGELLILGWEEMLAATADVDDVSDLVYVLNWIGWNKRGDDAYLKKIEELRDALLSGEPINLTLLTTAVRDWITDRLQWADEDEEAEEDEEIDRDMILQLLEGYRMIITDPDEYTTDALQNLLEEEREKWSSESTSELERGSILGLRVTDVRPLRADEEPVEGWAALADDPAQIAVIEFEDGTLVYASRDADGRAPGTLFGRKGEYAFALDPRPFF